MIDDAIEKELRKEIARLRDACKALLNAGDSREWQRACDEAKRLFETVEADGRTRE